MGIPENAKLIASDASGSDTLFGSSVSISGNTAIVGQKGDKDGNGTFEGAAYVFTRSNDGVWTEQTKLTASDGTGSDQFGSSVSISGNTAIVAGGQAAYIFARAANGVWTEKTKLTATDGLGGPVAISGDSAIVGADFDDDNGFNSGAAYIFIRSAGGVWSEQAKLTASDSSRFSFFGRSVSISGDTAIIGGVWL